MITRFRDMAFASMSDEYLLSVFSELCEMTSHSRPNYADWIEEFIGCKHEILNRLKNKEASL